MLGAAFLCVLGKLEQDFDMCTDIKRQRSQAMENVSGSGAAVLPTWASGSISISLFQLEMPEKSLRCSG